MNIHKQKKYQTGVSLAMSLVMLLILTILGTSALRTTIFEERMASNMTNIEYSFQAAEAALRDAEIWLSGQFNKPEAVTTCSSYPCVLLPSSNFYPEDQNKTWWQSNSAAYAGGTLSNVSTQPRYIIEYNRFVSDSMSTGQGKPSGMHFYRIIARGSGSTDGAVTIIEANYGRRF